MNEWLASVTGRKTVKIQRRTVKAQILNGGKEGKTHTKEALLSLLRSYLEQRLKVYGIP